MQLKTKFSALILSLASLSGFAFVYPNNIGINQAVRGQGQGFNACVQHFAGGVSPIVTFKPLASRTTELCSVGHATLHSGVTRTPLFSAEHLTKARLSGAKGLVRTDSFRNDNRLPHDGRGNLSDYAKSGYDRGHIAPNGDMSDVSEQSDSFLLSNIVPQNPNHNRQLWAGIERVTRVMAARYGEAYVVTGGAFLGDTVRIGSGVAVPTYMFKAIYFPSQNKASAWYSPNPVCRIQKGREGKGDTCVWDSDGKKYEVISIATLNKRIGIDVFPNLGAEVKSQVLEFYKPKK